MPYKNPADRRRYNARYHRRYYRANREATKARTRARKQRLKAEERRMKKCRTCGHKMTEELIGGRRFLECSNAACNRRILLDSKQTQVELSPESRTLLTQPAALRELEIAPTNQRRRGRPPKAQPAPASPAPVVTPVTTSGKRTLSAEARAKIGRAVAARHAREKAAKEGQDTQVTVHTPGRIEVIPPEPKLPATINKALRFLLEQEEQLQQQLDTNRKRQSALRDTVQILQEVGA